MVGHKSLRDVLGLWEDLWWHPEWPACCQQARSSTWTWWLGLPSPQCASALLKNTSDWQRLWDPGGTSQPGWGDTISRSGTGFVSQWPWKDCEQQQQLRQEVRTMASDQAECDGIFVEWGRKQHGPECFPTPYRTWLQLIDKAHRVFIVPIISNRGPTSFTSIYLLDNIYLNSSNFSIIFSAQCCYKMKLANNSI